MRRFIARVLVVGALCGGIAAAYVSRPRAAGTEDPVALQADRTFRQALASEDAAGAGRLLDAEFTWTDAAGKTWSRAQVLENLPKPNIGDEASARVTHGGYGQVWMIQAHSGKENVMRSWVKRKAGWRQLVYQEVTLLDAPPAVAPGKHAECDNPCKSLPYEPKNQDEKDVLGSFMQLQTYTVSRDSANWGKYVAEEFSAANSNSNQVLDKKGRMADLTRNKMAGYVPMPAVSMRVFTFGDTAVLVSNHQPPQGSAVHITRLWTKREGNWLEVASYQTRIQDPPATP